MTAPDLSVVIPYYNRAATIPWTLRSVREASDGLAIETIIVDDGSILAAADQLAGVLVPSERILRQSNQGLLFARLAGLRAAHGEFVLFLDSDDLVGREKLTRQIAALRADNADVSYTDTAHAEFPEAYELLSPQPDEPVEDTADSAAFFIRVQPAPHSPIFRRRWLSRIVAAPLFPADAAYNAVAEIWFYHVAAVHETRVAKVAGPHTIIGCHSGERLTRHWERLGFASLAVTEAFMRYCPKSSDTMHVRRLVGEKAFAAWRALPYDFAPEFRRRTLAVWRQAPRGSLSALGGPYFRRLARICGPIAAGWLLRRLNGRPYDASRTIEAATLQAWLNGLPSAK